MASRCQFGGECGIFEGRLAELPGLSEMFRTRYCETDPDRCVRHVVAELRGMESVPDALMPNNHERARELAGVRLA